MKKLSIDDIAEGVGISLDKDIDSNKITISSLATINPNKILGEYDTVLELETAYPDGSNLDGGFFNWNRKSKRILLLEYN